MKRLFSALCCSVFAAVILMPMSIHAQSESNHQTSSPTSQSKTPGTTARSPQNHTDSKMQVSKTAVHALRLTEEARQAVINKDQTRAQKKVDQALTLVNQVEQKMPANKKDNTHIVPIYAELEQTSFLAPALAASNASKSNGQQQESAKGSESSSGSNSNGSSSSNALPQSDQQMNNSPEVVKWVEGGYSYIGLDVDAAREHLQSAQKLLKENKPGDADLELARAEGSVVTGNIESNMPLVRARENLSLAQYDMGQGNYKKAKAELNAAGKALQDYSKDSQAPHAKEAKDLSSQIDSAANTISQNHTGVKQKAEAWWNKLADWTNQS